MSIYPITQSSSACLAPHPTPSLTGRVTSVFCQTGSHVTSVDPMICRSSSSPMQPTLPLEVYRYCSTTWYWHFWNQRLLTPPSRCRSFPALRPPHHHQISRPLASEGSLLKVIARGCGFECYSLVNHSSGSRGLTVLSFSASQTRINMFVLPDRKLNCLAE